MGLRLTKRAKKIGAVLGLILFLTGSNYVISAELGKNNKTNAINKDETIKEEIKKEEVIQEKFVGVNNVGKEHGYDAKIIDEKLRKYDYYNEGEKIVFLTFDDGTSTTVTPEVLKTMDKYDVKGTFFITGNNLERGKEESAKILKETFDKGHAIANHSYSHDYSYLYPNRSLNLENFKKDFEKTEKMLKDILGDNFSTRVIRCPGGHMSWKNMDELDVYLEESNMVSVDWNALNRDAEGRRKNSNELFEVVKETSKGKEIVVLLMHDTYGKEETAKSLEDVIKHYIENGYEFKTLI